MVDAGDRIRQQLGNYRLLHLLGRGSFAEVYLGEHIHLGTQAAIKVLYAKVDNDGMAAFRSEARTIASLEHRSIVRVLDFGVDGNTPFLVMNYAPGGTLRTRYPRGTRLPLPAVVSYVQQIASALQYAHERRLVHRDIKPENLLVGRNNEVLLSDFGIALVAQSSRYLHPQDVAGTIAYMAPEQIQSYPRPASDQYSLGVVVYEWLGGEVPFKGGFTDIAVKHALVPPPSLLEKMPSLPPSVEQVVFTALAKDPQQRFPTVRDFANALKQACDASQQIPQTYPMGDSTEYPSWQSTFVKTPSEQGLQPALLNTLPQSTLLNTSPVTPLPGPYASPITPLPNPSALQTTPFPDTNLPSFSGYTPTLEAFTSSVSTSKREAPRSFIHSTRSRVILIAVVCAIISAVFLGYFIHSTGSPPPVSTAKLVVDHSVLDFGKIEKGAKAALAVGLSNTGGQALQWTANVGSESWLSVQPGSGTITSGNKTLVNLTINTALLSPGNPSALLTIDSNGGNMQIPVKVQVFSGPKEAILAVSTTSITFGTVASSGQAASQSVVVSNEGVLALNWKATAVNGNWLTINPNSGTIQSGGLPQTIKVTVQTGLAAGSYSATLTISSNGGKPQTVQISITVGNAPGPQPTTPPTRTTPTTGTTGTTPPASAHMSLSPALLNFGIVAQGQLKSMALMVQNTGGQPLNWNANTGSAGWVTLNPGSGSIQPAGSEPITVTVNTQGLAPGSQSASLNFISNGGSQTVTVSGQVTAPPSQHSPLWVASNATNNIYSTAAVANGMVYAGSVDHTLYAWNASTGALVWHYTTGNDIYSSPFVYNNVVYVGSDDDNLYALDANSGTLLWSFNTGGQVRASPVVVNNVIYVGSVYKLYALDANTHAILWSIPTAGLPINYTTPVVVNGVIYVGSNSDNHMYALNASNGTQLWSFATGNTNHSPPAVVNGVVYFGSFDGNVYALDATSGAKIWSYATSGPIQSHPVINGNTLYIGSDDGNLYALDATTGSFLWKVTTGNAIHSSPAYYNGVVYIGSNDSKVYAVDAGSGAVLWTYTTGFDVGAAPTVANGVVYIGSGDDKMYAFTAS